MSFLPVTWVFGLIRKPLNLGRAQNELYSHHTKYLDALGSLKMTSSAEFSAVAKTWVVPFPSGDVCDFDTSNCSSVPAGATCQAG